MVYSIIYYSLLITGFVLIGLGVRNIAKSYNWKQFIKDYVNNKKNKNIKEK